MTQSTNSDHTSAADGTDRSFRFGKSVLSGSLVLVLLGVSGFFAQRWFAPEVDQSEIKPIVINSSGSNLGQKDGKAASKESTVVLSSGAITATIDQQMIDEAEHPFGPLLEIADLSIAEIDKKYQDYTATLFSQVRLGEELRGEKYLTCKIRHEQKAKPHVPFSVYTKFLKPKANVGQEAIWIQGQNDGKLIGHATGLLNLKRIPLDPDGAIAMEGNRYSIREIGFRNLLVKMKEFGVKDQQYGECVVTLKRGIELNGRLCTTFEAVHPYKRKHFDFHIARIYIDDERNIPIGYEGFLWPETKGGEPVLLERYFYTDIKLNVGLTDKDFDPGNEEYDYPRW